MASSRIDDLRKRLEAQPQSRLFAQLAEELRKAGELDEAVSLCRSGLETHANYPSARMTLGRALKEQGDLGAARGEFEAVVAGAPDNILASRLLGECLEALGETQAALERYRLTLALAPGDAQLTERIATLAAPARQGGAGDVAREADAVAPRASGPQGVPAAEEEEPAPLALVAADEDFELERPHESPTTVVAGAAPESPEAAAAGDATGGTLPFEAVAPPPAELRRDEPAPEDVGRPPDDDLPPLPVVAADEDFEIERPYESPPTVVSGAPEEAAEAPPAEPGEAEEPPGGAEEPASGAAVLPLESSVEPPGEELATVTLGELYLRQGHRERALETYRRVLASDPGNVRARARVDELEAEAVAGGSAPEAPAGGEVSAAAERKAAIEGTIGRLEAFLAAVRKGA